MSIFHISGIRAYIDWNKVQDVVSYFKNLNRTDTEPFFNRIELIPVEPFHVVEIECGYRSRTLDMLEKLACMLSKTIINEDGLMQLRDLSYREAFGYYGLFSFMIKRDKFGVFAGNTVRDIRGKDKNSLLIDCNNRQKVLISKEEIKERILNHGFLVNAIISDIDFSDLYFNDVDFRGTYFIHCSLVNVKFRNKSFENAYFYRTEGTNIDAENTSFSGAHCCDTNISFSNFTNVDMGYSRCIFEFKYPDNSNSNDIQSTSAKVETSKKESKETTRSPNRFSRNASKFFKLSKFSKLVG